MPIYSYKCSACGREFEAFNVIRLRELSECPCGEKANKVLSPIARPVVYEYWSENLNAYVTGPRQKQRLMKERGVTEAA